MTAIAKKIWRNLRYDYPVHFALRLSDWLPDNTFFLKVRGLMIRPFLGGCGRNLMIGRGVTLYNPSQIFFGSDIYIAYGSWLMAGGAITFESEVLLGPYCVVVSSQHLRRQGSFRFGRRECKPILLKAGCWVGAHVSITGGAVIGEGAQIGAGAVVTKEIPDNSLAGGIPARVLRNLTDSNDEA